MSGSERRKLAGLRAAIDGVPEGHRGAIAKMARMLGPDRLGGIEDELARWRGKPACTIEKAVMSVLASHFGPENMPEEIRSMRLEWFGISGAAGEALAKAGIITVGDFLAMPEAEQAGGGVLESAVKETELRLLGYGIRTIENPPLR
ncbi:hypothetical protein L0Y65_03685 [Candidatus Micrarchaeota archaeon]|nr:hypothetical protein [Candidatus Micrarchaeota archaeon]